MIYMREISYELHEQQKQMQTADLLSMIFIFEDPAFEYRGFFTHVFIIPEIQVTLGAPWAFSSGCRL